MLVGVAIGDVADYSGPAQRATTGEAVEIEGRFVELEPVKRDGKTHRVLEDVRAGEFPAGDPDLHRYLLPG